MFPTFPDFHLCHALHCARRGLISAPSNPASKELQGRIITVSNRRSQHKSKQIRSDVNPISKTNDFSLENFRFQET
jgi:hypothetical protein